MVVVTNRVIREGKANIRSIHAVIIRSNKEVSGQAQVLSDMLGHLMPQLGQAFWPPTEATHKA